jgi:hypothetical protein
LKAILGQDGVAYGIGRNWPSIEALLQYTHEHELTLKALFPNSLRDRQLMEGSARSIGWSGGRWCSAA